jgi:alpha-mannosidase
VDTVNASAAATTVTEPLAIIQTDSHDGPLPSGASFVHIDGPVVVSGVKMAESGDGWIVRLYNPSETVATGTLSAGEAAGGPFTSARQVDLLERPAEQAALSVSDGEVRVEVPPHGIVTLSVG